MQQLDLKKQELQKLEAETKEMQEQQDSYDDVLARVNQQWNQVELFAVVSFTTLSSSYKLRDYCVAKFLM